MQIVSSMSLSRVLNQSQVVCCLLVYKGTYCITWVHLAGTDQGGISLDKPSFEVDTQTMINTFIIPTTAWMRMSITDIFFHNHEYRGSTHSVLEQTKHPNYHICYLSLSFYGPCPAWYVPLLRSIYPDKDLLISIVIIYLEPRNLLRLRLHSLSTGLVCNFVSIDCTSNRFQTLSVQNIIFCKIFSSRVVYKPINFW